MCFEYIGRCNERFLLMRLTFPGESVADTVMSWEGYISLSHTSRRVCKFRKKVSRPA